jgi:hypothetical protein
MYKAILCSAFCALVVPVAADVTRAATSTGQFAIEGAGVATCSAFVAARKARTEALPQRAPGPQAEPKSQPDAEVQSGLDAYARFIGWVEGYLTGVNRYVGDTYDIAPWEAPELFGVIIGEHCEKNPDERLFSVVQKVVVTLSETRLKQPSPSVRLAAKGRTFIVYEEVVRRAQEALKRQNLYQGAADGQWNEATQLALAGYQALVGLEDTGLPDQLTLWLLFSPPVTAAAATTKATK